MIADFSSETMGTREKRIFQLLKHKNCQPEILYPLELSFKNEGEIMILSAEEKLRICHQQTFLKRMTKRSSLNRKEMKKEGILEYQEGKKEQQKE